MGEPSFSNGFASPWYGGALKYPSLWRGCIGAWAPLLGPTGGQLFDQSGRGNHFALTNMDTGTDWVISGRGGYALDFDGSDDHLLISSTPSALKMGTGPFSVSMWVKYNGGSVTGDRLLVVGSIVKRYEIWIDQTGGPNQDKIRFVVDDDVTRSEAIELIAGGNMDLEWHHIACVRNRSTAKLVVYFDGEELTNAVDSTSNSIDENSTTVIGRFPGLASTFWAGKIDDVRIFNRVLTRNEIWLLSGNGGKEGIGRGIAYQLDDEPIGAIAAAAAAGNRRRRLLLAC